MLKNKTIIVGVTGGIAAYKAATIVSRLKSLGAEVWVVMTAEAQKFVGPLTFKTLSGHPVITDLFSSDSLNIPHIDLANKADLILVVPATANIIGKLAYGLADDALTTIMLASTAKKVIAPAMNCKMWRNELVQENVRKLGVGSWEFVGPVEGKLACGVEDIGRMAEPEEIVGRIIELLVPRRDLAGQKIMVTAGGTREAIDPVRYISNRSSGKMGYAIAAAASERGADVTLISANVNLLAPDGVKIIKVESAQEMLTAVLENLAEQNAVIMAAAISDFRPRLVSQGKIKKVESRKSSAKGGSASGGKIENRTLELEETQDILLALSKLKNRKDKILVGFALETENFIENAKVKMREKGLDLIIANDASTFDSDEIRFFVIDRSGKVEDHSKRSKLEASNIILDKYLSLILRSSDILIA